MEILHQEGKQLWGPLDFHGHLVGRNRTVAQVSDGYKHYSIIISMKNESVVLKDGLEHTRFEILLAFLPPPISSAYSAVVADSTSESALNSASQLQNNQASTLNSTTNLP